MSGYKKAQKAIEEGQKACKRGETEQSCPFSESNKCERYGWLAGYRDTQRGWA